MKKFILLLLVLLSLAVILSGCVEEQNKRDTRNLVIMIYLIISFIRVWLDVGFVGFHEWPLTDRLPLKELARVWLKALFWPITVPNDIYGWYLKRKHRKENIQKISKKNKGSNR